MDRLSGHVKGVDVINRMKESLIAIRKANPRETKTEIQEQHAVQRHKNDTGKE